MSWLTNKTTASLSLPQDGLALTLSIEETVSGVGFRFAQHQPIQRGKSNLMG
jgi:hypothetical protein